MNIRTRRAVVLLLIGLAAVSAVAVSAYAFRSRLTAAPFIGKMFQKAAGGEAAKQGQAQQRAAGQGAPATADPSSGPRSQSDARADITIDPRRQQLIGVRTATVERANAVKTIRTVGVVRYDETRLADVNLKLEGWIGDLYVDYTGQFVQKGQPLFTLYSPELLTTQNEYLLALKTRDQVKQSQVPDAREYADRLVESARQRLQLWDLPADQFKRLDEQRAPQTTMVFRSPATGFVIEKQALAGMHVMPGQTLYKIANLSVVWVEADVYEQEMPLVRLGRRAAVSLDAYPGERFDGRVIYIYPFVEEKTRTVRVRFEFPNRGTRLKPGMYANIELQAPLGSGLAVPANALLDSGAQQIVFVSEGDGYFEPRRVKVGQRLGETVQILDGLKEGEVVATGATFFLDSESQLRASLQGYEPMPAAPGEAAAAGPRERFDITYRSQPDPPKTGNNAFEVGVKDPAGKPVTDAQVSVVFYMPPMPSMNMPAMRSEARLTHAGGGIYRGAGDVMMAGRWEVSVIVTRGGQRIGVKPLTVVAR